MIFLAMFTASSFTIGGLAYAFAVRISLPVWVQVAGRAVVALVVLSGIKKDQ